LIGFMATGKSTVGRHLAQMLQRPFMDTDTEIERQVGKPVHRIFAEDGEARFRAEEAQLCRKLAVPRGLVVATGGGMVLNPENVRYLQAGGVLIALHADPEVIYRRVQHASTRPLLRGGDLRNRLAVLLRERAGAYDLAEFMVDTGEFGPAAAARLILDYLKERKGAEPS
jgi:shikimate kinase